MILSKGVNPSENLGVSSFLSHPLLFLLFPFPFPSPPSFPFPGQPHILKQIEGLGSTVSSRSGVWSKAQVDKRFGAYLGQKEQLCFVYLSL